MEPPGYVTVECGSQQPPPAVAAACCDFTTCCYAGLCALLCFAGVAVTFIFSATPDGSSALAGPHGHQTWLLGPVLILLGALVAVKTLVHVRKQRARAVSHERWRMRRSDESPPLSPRGLDLPPSYEEVLKLMQEERTGAPPEQQELPEQQEPPELLCERQEQPAVRAPTPA